MLLRSLRLPALTIPLIMIHTLGICLIVSVISAGHKILQTLFFLHISDLVNSFAAFSVLKFRIYLSPYKLVTAVIFLVD